MTRQNVPGQHPTLHDRIEGFLKEESPLCSADIHRKLNSYEEKSIRNRLNAMHDSGEVYISCWRRSTGIGGRPTPYYALGTEKDAPAPRPLNTYRKPLPKEPCHERPARSRYVYEGFDPFVQLYRPAVDFIPDDAFEVVMRSPRF